MMMNIRWLLEKAIVALACGMMLGLADGAGLKSFVYTHSAWRCLQIILLFEYFDSLIAHLPLMLL